MRDPDVSLPDILPGYHYPNVRTNEFRVRIEDIGPGSESGSGSGSGLGLGDG